MARSHQSQEFLRSITANAPSPNAIAFYPSTRQRWGFCSTNCFPHGLGNATKSFQNGSLHSKLVRLNGNQYEELHVERSGKSLREGRLTINEEPGAVPPQSHTLSRISTADCVPARIKMKDWG